MKAQTKLIPFAKMHALGNDFVIMQAEKPLETLPVKHWADRHRGIGFDQLLIIEASTQADFFCRIFNADGSEAEQCGNGLRCVARYIVEHQLSAKKNLSLQTKSGIYPVIIENVDRIRIAMGIPRIQEKAMTLALPHHEDKVTMTVLDVGNPHAIIRVSDLQPNITRNLGPIISTHAYFPQGVNVGFMQIKNEHHIVLRTYERGSGETFACGSNACAAVAAGITNGWLQSPVQVECCDGSLEIAWEDNNKPIQMSGPATHVFAGEIEVG